jgi:hypothetical protein
MFKKLFASAIKAISKRANQDLLGKYTDSYDIMTFANIHAALDSGRYYSSKMLLAKNFPSNLDLLTHAVRLKPAGGLNLEFGVASGRTINHIATLTEETVYGFDVFTGLPESWRTGFEAGRFATPPPSVRENVKLVEGLFEETIDTFLVKNNDQGKQIAFLHIDCDIYSSTKTIFDKLGFLIKKDTIIVFDEYFNYPGWREHEFKAFQEFITENNKSYKYIGFVSRHQQVCIQII